jgi:transcriptional regulator with XRE-family HTH domain
MIEKPINDVLADNLAHFMGVRKVKQAELAEKSHVAQTTISLYLNPENRAPLASGKKPSAKLSEVESLAHALGIDVWQLLRNLTAEERIAYEQIESAFRTLKQSGAVCAPHQEPVQISIAATPKIKQKRISPANNQPNIKTA